MSLNYWRLIELLIKNQFKLRVLGLPNMYERLVNVTMKTQINDVVIEQITENHGNSRTSKGEQNRACYIFTQFYTI